MSTSEDRDATAASSDPPDPGRDARPRDDERRERGFVSRQAVRSGRWAATTAATTVLAAALISGAGATAAAADSPTTLPPDGLQLPRVQEPGVVAAPETAPVAAVTEAQQRRAAAVSAELSVAVAHGEVTQEQADAFLAKLLVRFSDA